jgi:hypothetical protein
MLVLHRSSHIPVAHRLHYGGEVSGVVQYSRAVILPAAIQNQIFTTSCAILCGPALISKKPRCKLAQPFDVTTMFRIDPRVRPTNAPSSLRIKPPEPRCPRAP